MTDTDRQRLAAILGMLGSDHAGERAAAGLQAEAFRRKHKLTWPELLALPPIEVVTAPAPPQRPASASPKPAWTPPPRAQEPHVMAPSDNPRSAQFVFAPWTPIPLTPWKPKKAGWFW